MTSPPIISAIFFDLDGTLRHNEPPAVATFHRIAAELGVNSNPEQRIEAERWTYAYWADSKELLEDLAQFGASDGNLEFWDNYARRHLQILGTPDALAIDRASIVTRKMRETYQPIDMVPSDVPSTLHTLRQAGYLLGLVSNRNKPLGEIVERLGLEQYFQLTLAAGEVGWSKPDPRLLLKAASLTGMEPDSSVYVGDNYYADVVSAEGAGMLPVLVDPRGIFPEARCPVIGSIGELLEVLKLLDGGDKRTLDHSK